MALYPGVPRGCTNCVERGYKCEEKEVRQLRKGKRIAALEETCDLFITPMRFLSLTVGQDPSGSRRPLQLTLRGQGTSIDYPATGTRILRIPVLPTFPHPTPNPRSRRILHAIHRLVAGQRTIF